MLKQNEVSRTNSVVIAVAHMSEKAKDDVFLKIYDLSAKYEYDTIIEYNLVTQKADAFHVDVDHLTDKKKIAFFNELKKATNAIEKL